MIVISGIATVAFGCQGTRSKVSSWRPKKRYLHCFLLLFLCFFYRDQSATKEIPVPEICRNEWKNMFKTIRSHWDLNSGCFFYCNQSATKEIPMAEICRKEWKIMFKTIKVPPRFELGLLDSESNVLTTRPWDHLVNILGTKDPTFLKGLVTAACLPQLVSCFLNCILIPLHCHKMMKILRGNIID